jgi:DNA-binding NtrC family response regulator
LVRILLVDDSPTIRLTLAAAIQKATRSPVELREAADAKTALKIFSAENPDAVFLDMMLAEQDVDGLQVQREMLAKNPAARIVLCTGLPANDPRVVKGIQEGAFAYLPKPARSEAVRKILNEMEAESGRFGRIR